MGNERVFRASTMHDQIEYAFLQPGCIEYVLQEEVFHCLVHPATFMPTAGKQDADEFRLSVQIEKCQRRLVQPGDAPRLPHHRFRSELRQAKDMLESHNLQTS
jgi:hypothetical protein